MVKDQSDSEREKPSATITRAVLSNLQLWFFKVHHPTDRTAHTTAFVTPVMEKELNRPTMEGSVQWRKEGNVLFNDALNTFYLRLYGVRHMVKDHSDSKRGNRCLHIGYSFRLAASFPPRQDNTHHRLCYTSRGALAGSNDASHHELHLAPQSEKDVLYQQPVIKWHTI